MAKLSRISVFLMLVCLLVCTGCAPETGVVLPTASPGSQVTAVTQPVATLVSAPAPSLSADLQGLEIEAFFEQSYNRWLLRYPENVTELGLVQQLDSSNDRLDDLSLEYRLQTQQLERELLVLLQSYDRQSMTAAQQLTADVYAWMLDDAVRGQAYMDYEYLVSQFITSVHLDTIQFFTEMHPLTNLQDAEDYVTRLSLVGGKFDQAIQHLERSAARGVRLPQYLHFWVISDLENIANSQARWTPFYQSFEEKLDALSSINTQQKQTLLQEAEHQINTSVIPVYQALVDYFRAQQSLAPGGIGVGQFPGGEEYYAYLARHHTTTELTPDEIHELGKQELARLQDEIRTALTAQGYDANSGLAESYARVALDGGQVSGSQAVKTYEALIQDADQRVSQVFDLRPEAPVIVIGGSMGGYYIVPAIDGSRPGAFYASTTGTLPRFGMPSLAYHEAIPGHHFQLALAQELPLPLLRKQADFTAFIEGWALYAERLMWELGAYDQDPYGNLGRLQYEAWRAARLVVDTGIHNLLLSNGALPLDILEQLVEEYIQQKMG